MAALVARPLSWWGVFLLPLLSPPLLSMRAQGSRREEEATLKPLVAELRSGDKWVRKRAVEALARLGSEAAWEHVVLALADPKGEVADTAEVLLGGIPEEAFPHLCGKEGLGARDPWVRRRAAEALGRSSFPPEADALAEGLRDPDPEARRMALFSVERLAAEENLSPEAVEGLLPLVQRLASSERDDLARARALFALALLDPEEARPQVLGAAQERAPGLRAAAARLLPRIAERGSAETELARLASDPARAVRTSAAHALAELGTRAAVLLLISRMEAEEQGRLSLRILDDLRRLSGLKHPLDPRPWRDWAGLLPEDWKGTLATRVAAPPEGGTAASFAGLPILSTRLAILIDLSGSIWKQRSDGRTKKEVVDRKLREALEGLPETTRFNLIPFTETPRPWQKSLVEATRKNVESAARFFEDRKESGTGNFWDAALLALEDPEVDTLLVLTDGVPTGGRRNQLELLVPLFLERNATAEVAVDSILVEAPPRIRKRWEALAEATGGLSIAIDLRAP